MPEPTGIVGELLARCRKDHLAWINGEAAGYALPDDGTILGGVGGYSHGGSETAARQGAAAAQWRSGSGEVEFLNGAATGELAWVSFIERAVVVLRADPAERRWDLRVTEVFRRDGDGWERVHRHADPLVDRRSLAEVAAFLD
jgi:ketosteroid isomerase-like protein